MRDYGKVSPQFWIGETGRKLRGDANAQVLALYLMTCPHSTMTGVFHCPVIYMAHETGMSSEGALKALARLSEVGFCEYDDTSETVFVIRMAAYQIGESLKPSDNRVAGLRAEVRRMPETRMKSRFLGVYGVAFGLIDEAEITSPSEAPSKPLPSQEQEQEQEKKKKTSSDKSDMTPGFVRFWQAWPKSDRKVAKAECAKRWQNRGLEQNADRIVAHVEAMGRSKQWRDGFEPAPLTYLNQRRWEDEAQSGPPARSEWWLRAGYGDEASARADGVVGVAA
jgi:hypothetical protein